MYSQKNTKKYMNNDGIEVRHKSFLNLRWIKVKAKLFFMFKHNPNIKSFFNKGIRELWTKAMFFDSLL